MYSNHISNCMLENYEHVTSVCIAKTQVSETEYQSQTEMNWLLKYKNSCNRLQQSAATFTIV